MAVPHGKLVKVKGKNMHVRQMGSGEKTIVLLPGLGCQLPSVDFAPLMRVLSKKYTVCTVELFGYGHSDGTDTPRTNENYVDEIREALTLSGLNPPYVIMPYSASGIYAEYYAAKYPNEIDGLILLDGSETTESIAKEWHYTEEMIKEAYGELEATDDIPKYREWGYTEEEIHEMVGVPNHLRTELAQDIALSANVYEVLTMPIPKNIPILVFNSEMVGLGEDERAINEQHRKDHIARLGGNVKKRVVIKGSKHTDIAYHHDYRKIICQEIDVFLECSK